MDELAPPPATRSAARPENTTLDPDVTRRAMWPLLAGYLAFGQFWGVWVIVVFDFQRSHDLTESRLGAVHDALAHGVVVMLLVAPRLQRLPLTVTQWLHASYALGGVTGAAIAGPLLAGDLDFRWGLAIAGAALVATAVWNARTAPPERSPGGAPAAFSIAALFRTPALWIPALAVLFAFLVEGSMDTWSGLYLREELDLRAAMAVVVVATLGIIVAGLLAPRSRV